MTSMTYHFDELIFRHYHEADLDRLHALLMATPETARYPEEISMEAIRDQLSWPGHVPERDRWVVVDPATPDALVGYSSIFKAAETPRADCFIIVRPEWRRRGIGARLFERVVEDSRTLRAHDVAGYVNDLDVGAVEFAVSRGATAVGAYTRLRASGDVTIEPTSWPTGYLLRAWQSDQDLATLVDASNQCYEGLWGHNVTTAEIWRHWLPSIDRRGIFFLFDERGAVVGIVRATPTTAGGRVTGSIDAPGVAPHLRGAGLYRRLLLSAMDWLATQGAVDYEVESWGDDPSVLDEYRALGFQPIRRETMLSVSLAERTA